MCPEECCQEPHDRAEAKRRLFRTVKRHPDPLTSSSSCCCCLSFSFSCLHLVHVMAGFSWFVQYCLSGRLVFFQPRPVVIQVFPACPGAGSTGIQVPIFFPSPASNGGQDGSSCPAFLYVPIFFRFSHEQQVSLPSLLLSQLAGMSPIVTHNKNTLFLPESFSFLSHT